MRIAGPKFPVWGGGAGFPASTVWDSGLCKQNTLESLTGAFMGLSFFGKGAERAEATGEFQFDLC